jgi:UDP-N-acetylmuramoylalanine--D-glutamate ligase
LKDRIVILGAAESGVGAAILASLKGYDVFVSDGGKIKEKFKNTLIEKNIPFEEGGHHEENILNAKEVIKSPGIPSTVDLVKKLIAKNIPVISDIEFAGRFTKAKMICITGSNGKTTTTLLTYHILKNAGFNVGLGGNVGKSFALQVAENNFDHYVLELSSFQLDHMYDFKADIAILVNITPDHLDRYEYKLENYAASKFRITQNQTSSDALIYCIDDEVTMKEMLSRNISATKFPFSIKEEVKEGAFMKNETINITIKNQTLTMSIHDLALQGKHNAYNSMASGIAARLLDIRKEVIRESLSDFQNVEHRLEFVAKIHDIEFINDSKATNVNSTWYALESMEKPIVWIVGGVDKGNDYSTLFEMVKQKVTAIICLGKDNEKLKKTFSGMVGEIVEVSSATEAVAQAYRLAKKDQVVLLSPACASFDLFENFEDRGAQFKKAVKAL